MSPTSTFWSIIIRLHQARVDRRRRIVVFCKGAGVAGIRALRRCLADHARSLCRAVSANLRSRPSADAAAGVHGRLAVLSEKLHAYAGALRYLRLRACDLSFAGA